MNLYNKLNYSADGIMDCRGNGIYKRSPLFQYSNTPIIFSFLKPISKFFIFFLLLFILSGCSRSKVIDENKFIKVYTDLIIAQDTAAAPINNLDSLKAIVFKQDQITADEYNATVEYLNKDPQRWEKFFNKAIAYVENLRKQNLPVRRKD